MKGRSCQWLRWGRIGWKLDLVLILQPRLSEVSVPAKTTFQIRILLSINMSSFAGNLVFTLVTLLVPLSALDETRRGSPLYVLLRVGTLCPAQKTKPASSHPETRRHILCWFVLLPLRLPGRIKHKMVDHDVRGRRHLLLFLVSRPTLCPSILSRPPWPSPPSPLPPAISL